MLIAVLASRRASANVASQLDYFRESEAAHCPDEAKLRQAISARLGYDPFIEWSPRRVVAEIAVNGSRLIAIIRLVEGGGIVQSRSELSADKDECAELIAAVALAIAIHLDPDSATRLSHAEPTKSEQEITLEPSPTEAPIAAPSPSPAPVTPVRKTTIAPPTPSAPVISAVRLGATVLQGLQPHTTYALKAGAAIGYRSFRGIAEVLADWPADEHYATGGIRSHAVAASLLPCVGYRWIAGCAEVMLDAIWARGTDVAVPVQATLWNLSLGARIEAGWEFNRTWATIIDFDLLRSLTPTALRLQQTPVWQSPSYRYAAGIGLEMRFP